ncbi:MAG: DsbE family thiol:disulfide interchange protein [Methylotenera sp.]|uniref:DsbE family thiol:disulfide interchange protein n=1 Tax=Methylotenera sp. TaxID=2051956 RepID=UPI002486F0D8|nr:DsbE family thiol:disulfide interchange protein [Methylotenera sp.]MDI1310165.1 DsbE family thiol:disulfide interchange protein [Methylotenera sp.]
MKRALIPLIIFLVVVGFLFKGLFLNPREVPSPLVGKPAPQFSLARLDAADATFSPKEMLDKVWLLNTWASWCAACKDEHPLLVELAKSNFVPIIGLNYKDNNQDAQKWLDEAGNPYAINAVDADGRVGIDYGVYGVPETYVIDKKGLIAYKQIGPITMEALRDKIVPLIKQLQAQ